MRVRPLIKSLLTGWLAAPILLVLTTGLVAQEADPDDDGLEFRGAGTDDDGDDTADIDTETTADLTDSESGLSIAGDFRPTLENFDRDERDGSSTTDTRAGGRARLRLDFGITELVHIGTRFGATCFTGDCDPEFVLESATPAPNGLKGGQVTLDEMYLHWFRTDRRSLAFGRLQTRSVLRGGVYAKSLDRNDSNNVNVTWTDGMQWTWRGRNNWNSTAVIQRNARDGTGSIRRGPLDFNHSNARNTYFVGLENISNWGPVVQRSFNVSYLPSSLLVDGTSLGRREDYWGLVGRLAFRWPQRSQGIRLRAGAEVGYAPETQSADAAMLASKADGLAWNVVASVMDFRPGHSIGLNYGKTGAGWLLSPQFSPNEELLEIRYVWRPERFALLEARLRHREDLLQLTGSSRKRSEVDFYLRLTWQFSLLGRGS